MASHAILGVLIETEQVAVVFAVYVIIIKSNVEIIFSVDISTIEIHGRPLRIEIG